MQGKLTFHKNKLMVSCSITNTMDKCSRNNMYGGEINLLAYAAGYSR